MLEAAIVVCPAAGCLDEPCCQILGASSVSLVLDVWFYVMSLWEAVHISVGFGVLVSLTS